MSLQDNILWIPNQPIKIDSQSDGCNVSPFEYKSILNADDLSQVQFQIFPKSTAPEQLSQTEFTTSVSSWTYSNFTHISLGDGYMYGTSSTSGNLYQDITVSQNAFLQVEIKLTANNTGGLLLQVGDTLHSLPNNQIGVFTYYGLVNTTKRITLTYAGTGSATEITVDYIRCKEVDLNYIFLVRNNNTNVVEVANYLRGVVDYATPNGVDYLRLIDNYVTWTIDWSDLGLSDGCYSIEVCDPVINTCLQNKPPNWHFLSNDLTGYTVDTTLGTAVINNTSELVLTSTSLLGGVNFTSKTSSCNIQYQLIISITAATSGVTIGYGFVGSFTTQVLTGATTINTIVTGNGDKMYFIFTGANGTQIKIDYIRLQPYSENDLQGNYFSQDFILTNDSCETVVIRACSDNDYTFGFQFPTASFVLSHRLQGRLTNANYLFDREAYQDVNGNVRSTWFNRRKIKALKIDLQPEYILDFLSLLGGMDHIYIDDVEFVCDKDEFINITYDSNLDDFAKVQLFLFEKDSSAITKAITSLGVGCSTTVTCVLDPADDTCVIDPITNDELISLE